MRKQKQCLCKVIVCLTLLLSMMPITTVCAKADFNTDAYINIDESYVYDGGCCDYNASASSGKNVSQMDEYSGYDYVIDSYNVQINVNEDNTFDITENINVYFNQARHGIYREIPLVNTVYRIDGTVSKNRAKVSNVSVSEQSSKSKTSDMYCIQIGSENVTVTGEKEYTIKYTYDIGADPLKNADEFYFNIIGSGWTSPIGGITFTINMPKKFDVRKLGFSAGYGGIFGTDKVEYEVNGNTITGGYNGIISPLEGLTVRLELPEGYFTHRID
ncbi:MAG: DUF2207 domain-containing protein, partial [Lachnospiraceae bacterium]|nr:DUF2207 domain-containing protein [Lachnospiraceae bacterium]